MRRNHPLAKTVIFTAVFAIAVVAAVGVAPATDVVTAQEGFDADRVESSTVNPDGSIADTINIEAGTFPQKYVGGEGAVTVDGEPLGAELDITAQADTDRGEVRFLVEDQQAFIIKVTQDGKTRAEDADVTPVTGDTADQVVRLDVDGENIDTPARPALSDLNTANQGQDAEVAENRPGDIGVDVTNDGDEAGRFDLTLTIENETEQVSESLTTQEIQPGGSTTATFEDPVSNLGIDEYNVTIEDSNQIDNVTGTLNVTEVSAGLTFNQQATASSSITVDGTTTPAVVVEDVSTNVDSAVVVTYENENNDLVIAGLETFNSGNLGDVTIPIEDAGGFPGNHTAHVIDAELLSNSGYSAGDVVSDQTANGIIANEEATILQSTVDFEAQTYVAETDTLNVSTANLSDGSGDTTLFQIDVHPTDADGNLIANEFVGSSQVLSGTNNDVTITLEDSNGDPVTIDETDDFVAMVHIVDDNTVQEGDQRPPGTFPVLSNADANQNGFVGSGVTDNATVTIDQPATPTFSNLDIAGDGSETDLLEATNESISADVENTGDINGSFTVDLTIENDNTADQPVDISTETDEISAGDSGTVTFEDITGNLAVGDYTVTIEDSEARDTVTGSLTINDARANVTLNEQATNSSTITSDGVTSPGVVVNTDANVNADLLITYEDNGENIIAGLGEVTPNDEQVTVPIENTSGFPGEHTAHTVLENDSLSKQYEVGDTVSTETEDVIDDQNSSIIYESTVEFDDQSTVGPADNGDLTVNATLDNGSGAASDRTYVVNLHETDNGAAGAYVGTTDVVTGAVTNEALDIRAEDGTDINISDTGSYIAMIHLVDDGTSEGTSVDPGAFPLLDNADRTDGFVLDGVSDSGEVTINQPATPEFSALNIATEDDDAEIVNGTNENVTVEVENVGDVAGNFTVNLSVGTVERSIETEDLNESETKTVTFEGVTGTLDAGDYTVTVADSDDEDSIEGNLSVLTRPDANLTEIDIAGQGDPAEIVEGDGEDVAINVTNDGEANGTFTINLTIGSDTVTENQPLDVAGGATETLTFENVTGELDADSAPYTVEVDTEDDTAVTGTLDVLAGVSDSTLTDLNVAGDGTSAEIVEGDDEDVEVSVTNNGTTTGAVSVNLEIGDEVTATERVTGLSADSTAGVTFENITGELAVDNYDVTVSTANDETTGDLTVLQPAESDLENLNIAGQGLDAEAYEGTDQNITADVENVGDVNGTFEIDLDIGERAFTDNVSIFVPSGETGDVRFGLTTGQAGEYNVTLSSADDEIEGDLRLYNEVNTTLDNLNITGGGNDTSITQGTDGDVTVDVANDDTDDGATNATLTIGGDAVETQSFVEIAGSDTETVTFANVTGNLGPDDYDVNVSTAPDTTISGTLTVESTGGGGGDDDDNGGGGGGGGGGASTADDTGDEGDDSPTTVQDVRSSINLIQASSDSETDISDSDEEQAGVNVNIEDSSSVRQINFNNEELTGSVQVSDYGQPPETIQQQISEAVANNVEGTNPDSISVISVTDITTTAGATEDTSATVEMTVDAATVNDPSQLVVYKETYSLEAQTQQFEQLDTSVVETGDEEIVLEVQPESFSLFAVTEIDDGGDETTGEPQDDGQTETGDDGSTDDGIPGFGAIVALVAIVAAALAAYQKTE